MAAAITLLLAMAAVGITILIRARLILALSQMLGSWTRPELRIIIAAAAPPTIAVMTAATAPLPTTVAAAGTVIQDNTTPTMQRKAARCQTTRLQVVKSHKTPARARA